MLAARAAMSLDARAAADAALVDAARRLASGRRRVAAYVPMPGEPGGPGLPDALAAVVGELLLPVLRADHDLDWALYLGGDLAAGSTLTRLREPIGPRLGVEALTTVDLVFVPALAVDPDGIRLGRGGGSYDRALPRVPTGVPVVALLYHDERRPALPADPHDHPVTAVLTPNALIPVRGMP